MRWHTCLTRNHRLTSKRLRLHAPGRSQRIAVIPHYVSASKINANQRIEPLT